MNENNFWTKWFHLDQSAQAYLKPKLLTCYYTKSVFKVNHGGQRWPIWSAGLGKPVIFQLCRVRRWIPVLGPEIIYGGIFVPLFHKYRGRDHCRESRWIVSNHPEITFTAGIPKSGQFWWEYCFIGFIWDCFVCEYHRYDAVSYPSTHRDKGNNLVVIFEQFTDYRRLQYYRSTSLNEYLVKLFSATFFEQKKCGFESKSALVL